MESIQEILDRYIPEIEKYNQRRENMVNTLTEAMKAYTKNKKMINEAGNKNSILVNHRGCSMFIPDNRIGEALNIGLDEGELNLLQDGVISHIKKVFDKEIFGMPVRNPVFVTYTCRGAEVNRGGVLLELYTEKDTEEEIKPVEKLKIDYTADSFARRGGVAGNGGKYLTMEEIMSM